MARYFQILTGLRGCYMPNNSYVVRCETRRELKEILQSEANAQGACASGPGYAYGLSKKDVAWAAAHAWRRGSTGAILPFSHERGRTKPFSIEIHISNREDYLAQEERQA